VARSHSARFFRRSLPELFNEIRQDEELWERVEQLGMTEDALAIHQDPLDLPRLCQTLARLRDDVIADPLIKSFNEDWSPSRRTLFLEGLIDDVNNVLFPIQELAI
jgi:hypothetical protein